MIRMILKYIRGYNQNISDKFKNDAIVGYACL